MTEISKRSLALFIGFLSQPSIFLTAIGVPFYSILLPFIIHHSRLFVLAIIGSITFFILFYITLISPDNNALRESIQLFVDVLGGYILYSYFKHKGVDYLNLLIEKFIKILFIFNLYLLFEFYTGAKIVLSVLSYITYWEYFPSSIPKMAYIWANPNSAGFTIVMLVMFYSCTSKKINRNIFTYSAFLLALISSKACFAIFTIIALYTFVKRKFEIDYFSLGIIALSLILFLASLVAVDLEGLMNTSSWINRSLQFQLMFPLIDFLPNGWPTDATMKTIFEASYEDTIAGIILFLYIFGYIGLVPIFLYFLIFVITRRKTPLVLLCFLTLSLTISTISISGLLMLALFLIITINNLKNEELYI